MQKIRGIRAIRGLRLFELSILLVKSATTRIAGGLMKGPRGTLSGVAPTNKITTNQSQITNDQFVICEWLFVIC